MEDGLIIEDPDYIIKGYREAMIALKHLTTKKYLAVTYKELTQKDGFIITAFITNKIVIEKEEVIWQKRR